MQYEATKTSAEFHKDRSLVRLLVGPLGSGKSVACAIEIFILMSQQKLYKGKRRSRWVIVRDTYPELMTTTLATWKKWFPTPETGRLWKGSPIIHYFKLGEIESEIIFLSLDRPDDVKKLMSLECTGIWFNEARYTQLPFLEGAIGRIGRYPSKDEGGSNFNGIIMDTNPPDDDHWIYKLFEEQKLKDYKVFHYEPALIESSENNFIPNPAAEDYVKNLDEGYKYYLKQIAGKSREWIKVYILGEYGTLFDGKPVYPEYCDSLHLRHGLKPIKGLPLLLGWDFGLTPACAIGQMIPASGQIIVFDEVTTERSGLTNFIKNGVKPLLSSKYADYVIGNSEGDPSGSAGEGVIQTCFNILESEGIKTNMARTNDHFPRKEAVSRRLSALSNGEPMLLISPDCVNIRKGLNGGYHYRRINVAVSKDHTRYQEKPEKNQYSHIVEAMEYMCLKYDSFRGNADTSPAAMHAMKNRLGLNEPRGVKRFV